jgi:hypothetical protein
MECQSECRSRFPEADSALRLVGTNPAKCPECELGLGCTYSSPSARFSALHTFQAFGNSENHATTACGALHVQPVKKPGWRLGPLKAIADTIFCSALHIEKCNTTN